MGKPIDTWFSLLYDYKGYEDDKGYISSVFFDIGHAI
jgi:hypothetical protein